MDRMKKNWTCQSFGHRHIVSLANRSEVVETLTDFCAEKGIAAGVISGIGAVDRLTLRFFNPAIKRYEDLSFEEQMEIANLTGNVSVLDGKTYLHLHVVAGRKDCSALAGHLLSARLSGAGEFIVEDLGGELPRRFDPEIGLNVYDF